MNAFMKVEGGEELLRQLKKMKSEFIKNSRAIFEAEARGLLQRAQARAPVDTGHLKASAFMQTDEEWRHLETAVAYADPIAPAVHEGIHGGRFQPSVEGRPTFKWLERSASESEAQMIASIVSKYRVFAWR